MKNLQIYAMPEWHEYKNALLGERLKLMNALVRETDTDKANILRGRIIQIAALEDGDKPQIDINQ